ncbi:MAG: hypothetical protein HY286_06025 [Planctomycetes bacterium]|nr:hypothetical protein [Planctomycetota bacterium]
MIRTPMRVHSYLFAGIFGISAGVAAGLAAPGRAAFSLPTLVNATPFDVVVHTGQTLIIDTSSATVTDAHGQTITFTNGNIFVNSLLVETGGTIIGQGPNALRFFVTDTATVHGAIRVDGTDAHDVAMLLTASQIVQFGAPGECGGGDGGDGNPDITKSNAKGGDADGATGTGLAGGLGGESALLALTTGGQPCYEPEDCHPAGGGGGTFGTVGESGRKGTDTNYNFGSCSVPQGVSAVNPNTAPKGGSPGMNIFTNTNIADDFLGTAVYDTAGITSIATAGVSTITTDLGIFSAADVGRFVGCYIAAPSTWEDLTNGCVQNNLAGDPVVCPRSHLLVRKIVAVHAGNQIDVQPAFPASLPTASKTIVKYSAGGVPTIGELAARAGGQGGGAGGNAIYNLTFPNPNYAFQDRVGAGGGGGAGILEIYASGAIDLTNGTISAIGGDGAAGENTINTDRVGGGSGGGSGGLVRIQSNTSVDMTNSKILARGGARGPGSYAVISDPVAPSNALGIGHGGRGGKGIVQIHAPSDDLGNLMITASITQLTPANFDPAPIFATPEFSSNPARQREMWFK